MPFPLQRYYRYMFLPGLLIFLVPSILRAYLLMPFPGSQEMDAIGTAYIMDKILPYALVIGGLLMVGSILNRLFNGSLRQKLGTVFLLVFLIGITYLANVRMSAEEWFKEPTNKVFATAAENKVPLEYLVVGVEHGGVAKAYPINYIGYHHKVQDSVGGKPVLVTYCTMCRTAAVFDPIVDGTYQTFRLVGAQHYNAIIEDGATGSWWYQATGEAGYGPKRGEKLGDIPYEQMTLKSWIEKHPSTLIMQPDPDFNDVYTQYAVYDRGRQQEKDSSGKVIRWDMGSWVVGLELDGVARAYEWIDLLDRRVVNDVVGSTPVVVALESDSVNYHTWKRTVDGAALEFALDTSEKGMRDKGTGSLWNWRGECVEGSMQGKRLEAVRSYQQYWHAWRQFRPKTERWEPKGS